MNSLFTGQKYYCYNWNDKSKYGLNFLPNVVLVECKNWTNPVSSIEVNWFCQKLASRGLDFGILIANNGITGNANDLNAAHNTIAFHLAQKRMVIVVTRAEINALNTTVEMIHLIKQKICLLQYQGVFVSSSRDRVFGASHLLRYYFLWFYLLK